MIGDRVIATVALEVETVETVHVEPPRERFRGVFEVEVSREDGTTIAMFSAREDELELVERIPEVSDRNWSAS